MSHDRYLIDVKINTMDTNIINVLVRENSGNGCPMLAEWVHKPNWIESKIFKITWEKKIDKAVTYLQSQIKQLIKKEQEAVRIIERYSVLPLSLSLASKKDASSAVVYSILKQKRKEKTNK